MLVTFLDRFFTAHPQLSAASHQSISVIHVMMMHLQHCRLGMVNR